MNNSENNDNFPKNTEYFFNLRISDIFADTETDLPRVKEQEGFDIHEKLKELTFDDLVGLILRLNNCGEMEEEGRRSRSEAWNLVTVARWVVHCIVLLYCNCIVVGQAGDGTGGRRLGSRQSGPALEHQRFGESYQVFQ